MMRAGSSSVPAACSSGQQELGGVEHALDVDVEHPVPGLGVLLGQRRTPVGAGVVDEDVERVPPLGHRVAEASGSPSSVERSATT